MWGDCWCTDDLLPAWSGSCNCSLLPRVPLYYAQSTPPTEMVQWEPPHVPPQLLATSISLCAFHFFILINFYNALNLCYTILHYITPGYRTWIHYSTTTRLVVVVIENQIYPCNQKSHWTLHCAWAISSWTRPCMLHMAPAVDHPCMHSLSHFFFCCQSHDWLDQPHSQTNLRLGSMAASPFEMKTMQLMIT